MRARGPEWLRERHAACGRERLLEELGEGGAGCPSERAFRPRTVMRSERVWWSLWARELAALEHVGQGAGCLGACGPGSWLLWSLWARELAALELAAYG